MQALILVGGEGTRLRPLTLTVPKPVVPLVDRPFIRYMIEWLARHGVDDIVLACGFLAAGVRDVLGEGGGGGPRLLDDRFVALNGDVLTDLDLTALIELHEQRDARATLALYPVDDPSAYGLVRRREDGEITEFLEKPDADQIDTDEVNAGAYVLEKSILDLVPDGREVSIEREVFPRLVGDGLYGRRLDGYWMDIGTPDRYLRATWDILERRVETDVGQLVNRDGLAIDAQAEVADEAEVTPPALLERRASVAGGARVGARAVLGPVCAVGEDAVVEGSVLHRGCTIGRSAAVTGAILAGGVEVGERATVHAGAVIGEGARVAAGAEVAENGRVDPAATVE
jgi:mannose-1-phosphate guanylyltransferase